MRLSLSYHLLFLISLGYFTTCIFSDDDFIQSDTAQYFSNENADPLSFQSSDSGDDGLFTIKQYDNIVDEELNTSSSNEFNDVSIIEVSTNSFQNLSEENELAPNLLINSSKSVNYEIENNNIHASSLSTDRNDPPLIIEEITVTNDDQDTLNDIQEINSFAYDFSEKEIFIIHSTLVLEGDILSINEQDDISTNQGVINTFENISLAESVSTSDSSIND